MPGLPCPAWRAGTENSAGTLGVRRTWRRHGHAAIKDEEGAVPQVGALLAQVVVDATLKSVQVAAAKPTDTFMR